MSEHTNLTIGHLVARALEVREQAYARYSRFKVGAALLGEDGRVFTGCNVENASFGLTCCAERVAIFNAVTAGCRRFSALAVASAGGAAPCGACRQVIREFAPRLTLYLAVADGSYLEERLERLLPDSFGPEDLVGRRKVRRESAASRVKPRALRKARGKRRATKG
ncbi:MAG: cytidine deaminase [Planctomycetota bacterium]